MSVSAVYVVSGRRRAIVIAERICVPIDGAGGRDGHLRRGDVRLERDEIPFLMRRGGIDYARTHEAGIVSGAVEWDRVGDVPPDVCARLLAELRRVEEERAVSLHWRTHADLRRRKEYPMPGAALF